MITIAAAVCSTLLTVTAREKRRQNPAISTKIGVRETDDFQLKLGTATRESPVSTSPLDLGINPTRRFISKSLRLITEVNASRTMR